MPLTVKNPLNNEIIVGEVEFYLVKNNGSEQMNAEFIGTDYNYACSNDFRKMFLEHSIENDDIKA